MAEQRKQEESKEKAQVEKRKAEKEMSKIEEQSKVDVKEAEESKKSEGQLSKKLQDIISTIESMTVLELSNLVKVLEEKFGVTAAQPMAATMGIAGVASSVAAAPVEEKSAFTIVLANVGANKIQVIKEIRAITTLGLKEAKDLVESAPKTIKEGVPKEEAEQIKKKLEAAGAKIELK